MDIPSFSGDVIEQLRADARESKKRKLGEQDDDSDAMNSKETAYHFESDPNDREKTKYT